MPISPSTTDELKDAVASASGPLEIVGTATKRGYGRPVQAAETLSLARFSGVHAYEPEELILEAGAGTPRAMIEALLAKSRQYLAFEPPDLSLLYGGAHAGTLGGMIACNLSGPRRLKAGAARDHVLGVSGVTGAGVAFKSGARVVKNVTGYDLSKLMTGSFGTLAALTSIILKVLPAPETEETVVVRGLANEAAIAALSKGLQSACEVSGAAHLPADVSGESVALTLLRIEGISASVSYRRDRLVALLKDFGAAEVIPESESRSRWIGLRDVQPLREARDRVLWRISVAPSAGPRVLARLRGARGYFDWAGGLLWLDLPETADASAAAVRAAHEGQGHATLLRAPDALRASVAVFQQQAPALAALGARVRAAFDPKGLLNPGRMS